MQEKVATNYTINMKTDKMSEYAIKRKVFVRFGNFLLTKWTKKIPL